MLGQLHLLAKTMQKNSKALLQYCNSCEYPKMDIEITCDTCNVERKRKDCHDYTKNNFKEIKFRNICYEEYLKLLLSLLFILVQIVIISLVLVDLIVEKHKYKYNQQIMGYQGINLSRDICVNFPAKSSMSRKSQHLELKDGYLKLHCFNQSAYIRHLFEMMTLGWFRRSPYSVNLNEAETTVNQGFIRGSSLSESGKDCPKPSTVVKLKNLLTNSKNGGNTLVNERTGMFMVYTHLNVRNVQRCPSGSTEVKLKNAGSVIISDVIHPMSGLLVSQQRFYTVFLKLHRGTHSQFVTTDATQIESHWKANIMGSVLMS